MNDTPQLTEEMAAGSARLRIDVHGGEPREHVLDDMSFMNYRLADVRISPDVTLAEPDIVWRPDGDKAIAYDGRRMTFTGAWPAGPIQKVIVTMLALRMEAAGLHPFHSSAVRYRGQTVMFLGGESNHGKSMGQIEACRRGAQLVSTETTVTDEDGVVQSWARSPCSSRSAPRAPSGPTRPRPERGVQKFFGDMPAWEQFETPAPVDVVIVPAIDGNFDPSTQRDDPVRAAVPDAPLARRTTSCSTSCSRPGMPMPIVDTEALRKARAAFVERFADRPYYFVRAATPQVLLDEVDRVL